LRRPSSSCSRKKTRRVDEQTLQRIAQELGMSEEDLAKAREESRTRKLRAQALRSSGALDECIRELDLGYAFNPLDLEIMYALADALFSRSQKNGDDAEWARAKDLCLRVIETAPAHKEAPSLLNAITNADPKKRSDAAIPVAIVVAIGAVGLLGVGALLHFLLGLF
jgi:hypothetical protein